MTKKFRNKIFDIGDLVESIDKDTDGVQIGVVVSLEDKLFYPSISVLWLKRDIIKTEFLTDISIVYRSCD